MTWVERYFIEDCIRENNMFGYTFEVTNTKTGDKYTGKKYAVTFDKDYLGEDANEALAVAIEKYGRPAFEVKMLMPYETQDAVDAAFAEIQPTKKTKRVVVKETPDVAKDDKMVAREEKVVEAEPEEKPVKKRSTKKV